MTNLAEDLCDYNWIHGEHLKNLVEHGELSEE